MTVGERIKQMRESLGMTQDDLAKKLGYSINSLHKKIKDRLLTYPFILRFITI